MLSPANHYAIKAKLDLTYADGGWVKTSKRKAGRKHRHIKEVVMFRCPDCRELHDYEDEAAACCDDLTEPAPTSGTSCPVCNEYYLTHRDASDCCLWKDLDAATRWSIADAVEAGAEWAESLGVTISS